MDRWTNAMHVQPSRHTDAFSDHTVCAWMIAFKHKYMSYLTKEVLLIGHSPYAAWTAQTLTMTTGSVFLRTTPKGESRTHLSFDSVRNGGMKCTTNVAWIFLIKRDIDGFISKLQDFYWQKIIFHSRYFQDTSRKPCDRTKQKDLDKSS